MPCAAFASPAESVGSCCASRLQSWYICASMICVGFAGACEGGADWGASGAPPPCVGSGCAAEAKLFLSASLTPATVFLAAFLALVHLVAADDLGVLLVTCHAISSQVLEIESGSGPLSALSRFALSGGIAGECQVRQLRFTLNQKEMSSPIFLPTESFTNSSGLALIQT